MKNTLFADEVIRTANEMDSYTEADAYVTRKITELDDKYNLLVSLGNDSEDLIAVSANINKLMEASAQFKY